MRTNSITSTPKPTMEIVHHPLPQMHSTGFLPNNGSYIMDGFLQNLFIAALAHNAYDWFGTRSPHVHTAVFPQSAFCFLNNRSHTRVFPTLYVTYFHVDNVLGQRLHCASQ